MARLLLLVLVLLAPAALAVEPGEMLDDPGLEARARAISKDLRCLVCQNQSIDDSNADLAHDLRVIVRERLVAGDSDEQVVAYVVARYGDFVLLDPPFKATTWALWLGPFAILLVAGAAAARYVRRQAARPDLAPPPLSEAEGERLRRVLGDGA